MIYKDLSLLSGGGIIDYSLQADQEECATVLIGLGGTGISCLQNVKQQVYKRLKPDDVNSCIPKYQHIQFLAIDSDRTYINDESFVGIDSVNEFIDIGSYDINALIRRPDLLYNNPSMRWFSDKVIIHDAQAGAGGVRQIGRLLVMQNVSRIVPKIKSAILQAMAGLRENSPLDIHIFTGMGGGTGSGAFLDICYIIRHIIEELALGSKTIVAGYFFLPGVNLEKVHADAVRKHIKINGYAAMKELDYCMNFCNNGGNWNQSYGYFEVNTNAQPVNLAHLISAIDENGVILPDGYNYAINVVTDYVLDFMIKHNDWGQNRASGYCGLIKYFDTYNNVVQMLPKKRGASYYYCVLGASNAYIPYIDINTYLAAKIFKEYDLFPKENHDTEDFVAIKGLSYAVISKRLVEGVPSIPAFSVDKNTLYEQVLGLTSNSIPRVLTRMRDSYCEINEKLKTNKDSLCVSFIESVKEGLSLLAQTPGRGPFYASLHLRNPSKTDKDLIDIIEGYITLNESHLRDAYEDINLREEYMGAALNRLQTCNALTKKRRAEDYVNSVWDYFLQLATISKYVIMGELLNVFKHQLIDLYDNTYAHILKTLKDISETFDANLKALDEKEDDDYAIKIIGLHQDEIKKWLDEEAEKMDRTDIVSRFVSVLFGSMEQWRFNSDGKKISNIVSTFFAKELRHVNLGIDSCLKIKYNVEDQHSLATKIYNDLMVRLKHRATPLFWVDYVDGPIDSIGKRGDCIVPNVSPAIMAAGNALRSFNPEICLLPSLIYDRITMIIINRCVPLYKYRGLYVYKEDYEQSSMPGLHIYEGTELDPRDFRKLRGIIPLSLYREDELEDVKDFVDYYDRAVKNGIIYKKSIGEPNFYEYQLRLIDDEDFLIKKERIEAILKKYANTSGEEQMKCIEEAKDYFENDNNTQIGFKDGIILPNDGFGVFKDSVVRDHVFASEYYTSILLEQLKKIDELDSMILRLQQIAHSKN